MFEEYNQNAEEERYHIKKGIYTALILVVVLIAIFTITFLFSGSIFTNNKPEIDIETEGIPTSLTEEERKVIEEKFKNSAGNLYVSDTQKTLLEKNFVSSQPPKLSDEEKRAIEEKFNNR